MKLTKKQLKETISEVMYGDQSHLDDAEVDYDYEVLADAVIDYLVGRTNIDKKTKANYRSLEIHFRGWEFDEVKVKSISYAGSNMRILVQTPDGPKTIALHATVVD